MMSCITPTKRLDMWFKDLSVKTTEYSSSPSGSTSRRGRLTSADCHRTPSHWSANPQLRGTQRPHRTHLDGAGEVLPPPSGCVLPAPPLWFTPRPYRFVNSVTAPASGNMGKHRKARAEVKGEQTWCRPLD